MRNTPFSLLITTFVCTRQKDRNHASPQTFCKSQLSHSCLFQNHCPLPHTQAKLIATIAIQLPKSVGLFHEKRLQSPRILILFTAVSEFTHRENYFHAPRRLFSVTTKTKNVFFENDIAFSREVNFVLARTKQGFHKNQTAFLQEACMVFAPKQQRVYQKELHFPFFNNGPFSKASFSEGKKSSKIIHLARKNPSKSKNRHLRHQTFSPRKRPLLYNLAISVL